MPVAFEDRLFMDLGFDIVQQVLFVVVVGREITMQVVVES
jgi:hypothetical protein